MSQRSFTIGLLQENPASLVEGSPAMKPIAIHRDPVGVRTVEDIVLLVLHEEVAGNLVSAAERIVQALQCEQLLSADLVAS